MLGSSSSSSGCHPHQQQQRVQSGVLIIRQCNIRVKNLHPHYAPYRQAQKDCLYQHMQPRAIVCSSQRLPLQCCCHTGSCSCRSSSSSSRCFDGITRPQYAAGRVTNRVCVHSTSCRAAQAFICSSLYSKHPSSRHRRYSRSSSSGQATSPSWMITVQTSSSAHKHHSMTRSKGICSGSSGSSTSSSNLRGDNSDGDSERSTSSSSSTSSSTSSSSSSLGGDQYGGDDAANTGDGGSAGSGGGSRSRSSSSSVGDGGGDDGANKGAGAGGGGGNSSSGSPSDQPRFPLWYSVWMWCTAVVYLAWRWQWRRDRRLAAEQFEREQQFEEQLQQDWQTFAQQYKPPGISSGHEGVNR